ncbi:MAG: aldehyde dehydrogenase family protein [Bdellovibrionaceae bacterium]|nr:aldehyde dehydrogenase family protein [Pseudobdellovibrionaceae bacterium]
MSHSTFTSGATSTVSTPADFTTLIKAIQFLNKHALPHYRASKDYSPDVDLFFKTIKEQKDVFVNMLTSHLGYSTALANTDFEHTLRHFSNSPISKKFNPTHSMPQGLVAVYGSWSSPLYRFIQHVLPALTNECSVLLFCEPEASSIYCKLAEVISATAFATNRLVVLPIVDKEVLSTLLDHPSIHAVSGQMNLHQAPMFRERVLSAEKTYSLHFGAHNPVIFLNDYEDSHVDTLLASSLQFHMRSEVRFNRWFVQEKIYPDFIEKLKQRLDKMDPSFFGNAVVKNYQTAFEAQQKELSNTKHWLLEQTDNGINICSDFSNCSPLHQTELLGSRLTITRFKNGPEATKFAGTTHYSNATCIITASQEKYMELAGQQLTPFVFLNTLPDVFDSSLNSGLGHCSLITSEIAYTQPRIILSSYQYSHSHSTGCC